MIEQPQAEPSYSPLPSPPALEPSGPPRRSCLSRLGGAAVWLLTMLITAVLTLAAAGAIAYYLLGYSWSTPADLARTRTELVALGEQNRLLQTEVAGLSARSDEIAGRVNTGLEDFDELAPQVRELQLQATSLAALTDELRSNVAQAATVQAEARDSRAAVSAFATIQADSTARMIELTRRTDRIVRFLSRLGDIADDAALDLEPTPTLPPDTLPTPTPPQPTPTSTSVALNPTGTPSP